MTHEQIAKLMDRALIAETRVAALENSVKIWQREAIRVANYGAELNARVDALTAALEAMKRMDVISLEYIQAALDAAGGT